MNNKALIVGAIFIVGAVGFNILPFFRGEESEKSLHETLAPGNTTDSIIINNQGGSMEGHTPRGFQGMGTGLFAGDNLNSGFPNNDGVQFFLTFDLGAIPSGASVETKRGVAIASAVLRSKSLHVQGSPFTDLGELSAEAVRYDAFSSALWNLQSEGRACAFDVLSNDSVACTVTDAVREALGNGTRLAQFRIRFEKVGDGDGEPDLALFYTTDSNKNETGIFQLEITTTSAPSDGSVNNDIHIPVVLHIVKNGGIVNTIRGKDTVLNLFQETQAIWNQANIVFDATIVETALPDDAQKAVLRQDFEELYTLISPTDRAFHVFFVKTLHGPNGIAIAPSLALIADNTTVNDFRATAHELGHLLGLTHTDESRERLLFRGVNGIRLTQEEVITAKTNAKAFKSAP